MSAKAKPKRQARRAEDLEVLRTKPRTGPATLAILLDGPEPKAADNGKVSRGRKPAKKTKKHAKTANELMLEAWKYSWENRHRRLTKP